MRRLKGSGIKIKHQEKGLSFIFGFLLLGLILFFLVSNIRIFEKRTQIRKEIKWITTEIEEIKKENEKLKQEIERTKGEGFWEAQLRERGYKKQNEEVIIINPEKK